jgi:hypothetical protein
MDHLPCSAPAPAAVPSGSCSPLVISGIAGVISSPLLEEPAGRQTLP